MAMLNNQRVSKNEHLTWLVGGWAYPSEKYDFVSWDDEIPNIWKKKKHQPHELTVNQWEYITDIFGEMQAKIYHFSLSEDGLHTPKL